MSVGVRVDLELDLDPAGLFAELDRSHRCTRRGAHHVRDLLEAGSLPVSYHESDAAHFIDQAHIPAATHWLSSAISS